MRTLKTQEFYLLGEFVAEVMLEGIIHYDMQDDNIGLRNGKYIFLDYADAEKILMPDGLNSETVRKMTEALLSAIDNAGTSFENNSYFRAGFLAYGGTLAWNLFYNTSNNGYCSKLFTKENLQKKNYDASVLYMNSEIIEGIRAWKRLDKDNINLNRYDNLEKYNISKERKKASKHNLFFVDTLYLVRSCLAFMTVNTEGANTALACALLNMACLAMNYGYFYTEYGLLKKCLSIENKSSQITSMCDQKIRKVRMSGKLEENRVAFIDMCVSQYSLFELLWILNDEDVIFH